MKAQNNLVKNELYKELEKFTIRINCLDFDSQVWINRQEFDIAFKAVIAKVLDLDQEFVSLVK